MRKESSTIVNEISIDYDMVNESKHHQGSITVCSML